MRASALDKREGEVDRGLINCSSFIDSQIIFPQMVEAEQNLEYDHDRREMEIASREVRLKEERRKIKEGMVQLSAWSEQLRVEEKRLKEEKEQLIQREERLNKFLSSYESANSLDVSTASEFR